MGVLRHRAQVDLDQLRLALVEHLLEPVGEELAPTVDSPRGDATRRRYLRPHHRRYPWSSSRTIRAGTSSDRRRRSANRTRRSSSTAVPPMDRWRWKHHGVRDAARGRRLPHRRDVRQGARLPDRPTRRPKPALPRNRGVASVGRRADAARLGSTSWREAPQRIVGLAVPEASSGASDNRCCRGAGSSRTDTSGRSCSRSIRRTRTP